MKLHWHSISIRYGQAIIGTHTDLLPIKPRGKYLIGAKPLFELKLMYHQ